MVRGLFQIGHIRWKGGSDLINDTVKSTHQPLSTTGHGHGIPVNGNCPALEARVCIFIPLEDLERDALLSETLGEAETPEAPSNNKNMHFDGSRSIGY